MGQATPSSTLHNSKWQRTRICPPVSVPRLHYHRYAITGCRTQHAHRQCIDSSLQTHQESMGNKHLTIPTKINVYKACVISTLLYGSESWTTYSTQEQKLQVFHLRCLCRILGITWQDKVQNSNVLLRVGVPSMFTSYINAIYAGWAMFTGWKMDASPRIYSMVSLPLGLGVEATPNYVLGCMQA